MDNYSIIADILSKFHMSGPWIQTLWILVLPSLFFGTVFGLGWCLKETIIAFIKRTKPDGKLVCGLYQNDDVLNVYCYTETGERIDPRDMILLPVGAILKQINAKQISAKQTDEETDNKDEENV